MWYEDGAASRDQKWPSGNEKGNPVPREKRMEIGREQERRFCAREERREAGREQERRFCAREERREAGREQERGFCARDSGREREAWGDETEGARKMRRTGERGERRGRDERRRGRDYWPRRKEPGVPKVRERLSRVLTQGSSLGAWLLMPR